MSSQRRIAVVTDDAAALPPEWTLSSGAAESSSEEAAAFAVARSERSGLAVAAMPVSVEGQTLTGPESGRLAQIEEALAQGRTAATSRPSPGQVLRQFRQLEAQGFEGIVSVHCSAELSGAATSARIASAAVGIPVEVVDTRTIAMAQGRGALDAWEAAGRGADLAEVAEAARAGSAAGQLLLWVPGLETLRRGGRIGPSAAALGSMLQVKPILRVTGGQLAVVELPMTEQRALTRLLRRAGRALRDSARERPLATVHHLLRDGGREAARDVAEQLLEQCPDAEIRCLPMPAVLAAHAGTGALAIVAHG